MGHVMCSLFTLHNTYYAAAASLQADTAAWLTHTGTEQTTGYATSSAS